jgi:hypothetical protein
MDKPGFPEDEAVLLAGQPDSWSVDDGHHQLKVLGDDPVEELLVALQETHDVDVSVEVAFIAEEVLHNDEHLLALREDGRRQEAMDAQQLTLLQRESTPLE